MHADDEPLPIELDELTPDAATVLKRHFGDEPIVNHTQVWSAYEAGTLREVADDLAGVDGYDDAVGELRRLLPDLTDTSWT